MIRQLLIEWAEAQKTDARMGMERVRLENGDREWDSLAIGDHAHYRGQVTAMDRLIKLLSQRDEW